MGGGRCGVNGTAHSVLDEFLDLSGQNPEVKPGHLDRGPPSHSITLAGGRGPAGARPDPLGDWALALLGLGAVVRSRCLAEKGDAGTCPAGPNPRPGRSAQSRLLGPVGDTAP